MALQLNASIGQSIDSTSELLELIYDGPLEARPWQAFLNRLQTVTNATRLSIQLHQPDSTEHDVRVTATHPESRVDWQALKELYRQKYIDSDPIRSDRLIPGRIVTIEDCAKSPNYLELMVPMNITHVIRTCFSEPSGMRCCLELVGHAPLGPFNKERDVQLLGKLLPHLSRALRLYAQIMRARTEQSVYKCAMEHLAFGSVLLDGDGRIMELSSIASELVEKYREIRLEGDRMVLADREANQELQRAIATAAEIRKDQLGLGHVDLVRMRCSGASLIGFLVIPIPLLTYYQGAHAPGVIIYMSDLDGRISDTAEHYKSVEQLLRKMFKLTTSEAALAVLLADGLSLAEAAAKMGLTEGSARNYSKRIYEKAEVNRQPSLVRCVYKSVALLG
jgi:DNA-binding CsgD family transcriptional regulator